MAKLSGKQLVVQWIGSGGTTNLSGAQRSFSVDEAQETADSTAGADDYRNYVNTVKTISASMEMVYQEIAAGGSAILTALALGAEGTLLWGPEGSASGKPKKGFAARVTNASQSMPFDDMMVISVEFANNGTALVYDGISDTF